MRISSVSPGGLDWPDKTRLPVILTYVAIPRTTWALDRLWAWRVYCAVHTSVWLVAPSTTHLPAVRHRRSVAQSDSRAVLPAVDKPCFAPPRLYLLAHLGHCPPRCPWKPCPFVLLAGATSVGVNHGSSSLVLIFLVSMKPLPAKLLWICKANLRICKSSAHFADCPDCMAWSALAEIAQVQSPPAGASVRIPCQSSHGDLTAAVL